MAVNPVTVACAADVWTKVATNVLVGTIYQLSFLPAVYLQTIRITGDAAPANDDDAAQIFGVSAKESGISSDTEIDVYVKALRFDGEVRVDL